MAISLTLFAAFILQLRLSLSLPQALQQYIESKSEHGDYPCAAASASDQTREYNTIASERIAIIGSGITGSVAAYTLTENARQNSQVSQPLITIFEQNPVVGGRVTTTQVFGQPELTIDTCAATINPITDQCITSFATLTGLSATIANQANNGSAVWNGDRFVGFVEATGFRGTVGESAFKMAKFRGRYGNAPFNTTDTLTQSRYALLGRFTFSSLLQEVTSVGLNGSLLRSACEGVNDFCKNDPQYDLYLKELIEAGVRDRFFGNFDDLNELNSILGLATSQNLVSVDGGNLRLIDRLIKLSGAQLLLNAKVESLTATPANAGSWKVKYVQSGKSEENVFDKVIIAAPFSLASITIQPKTTNVPLVEFTDTVVTHFTSKRSINAAYFNTTVPVPQEILTSTIATNTGDRASVPFFNFRLIDNNIQRFSRGRPTGDTENLYKLVSSEPLSDNQIEALLDQPRPDDNTPGISWINREILPKSVPRLNRALKIQDKIEIANGLYYAGGAAQVADTVDFACKMGRNAAKLIIPMPIRERPGNGF